MPETTWADAIGRYLPAQAAREIYQPSLADLRVEWLRRHGVPARGLRPIDRSAFALAVVRLWLQCLRLSAVENVARRFTAPPSVARSPIRKDYRAMVLQDLRRALRTFRLEPAFTAAAVLTLALGIGANAALFAVVEAILLRPLPVADADRLVILKHRDRGTGISKEFIALGDYLDLQAHQQSIDLAAYGGFQSTLLGDHEPLRIRGLQVVPAFFEVMQLQPALGRMLGPDDAREGAPPAVMISYDLWQSHFGGDPGVVRRSLQLGNTRRMVVGVAPRGFHFPPDSPTHVITALALPPSPPAQRKSGWVFAVGRLRGDQTQDRTGVELEALRGSSASSRNRIRGPSITSSRCAMPWSARRSGPSCCCWPRSRSSCSSPAPMSATCCWRGRCRASRKWRCASRLAPLGGGWPPRS